MFASDSRFSTIDISSEADRRDGGGMLAGRGDIVPAVNIDLLSEVAPTIIGLLFVVLMVMGVHHYVTDADGIFYVAVVTGGLWAARVMLPRRRTLALDRLDVERALALVSMWFVYSALAFREVGRPADLSENPEDEADPVAPEAVATPVTPLTLLRPALTLFNGCVVLAYHYWPVAWQHAGGSAAFAAGLAALAALPVPGATVLHPLSVWIPALRIALAYSVCMLTDLLTKSRAVPMQQAYDDAHNAWRRAALNTGWLLLGDMYVVAPCGAAFLAFLAWKILQVHNVDLPLVRGGVPSSARLHSVSVVQTDSPSSSFSSSFVAPDAAGPMYTETGGEPYEDDGADEESESEEDAEVSIRDATGGDQSPWVAGAGTVHTNTTHWPASQSSIYGGGAAPLNHVDSNSFRASAMPLPRRKGGGARAVRELRKK